MKVRLLYINVCTHSMLLKKYICLFVPALRLGLMDRLFTEAGQGLCCCHLCYCREALTQQSDLAPGVSQRSTVTPGQFSALRELQKHSHNRVIWCPAWVTKWFVQMVINHLCEHIQFTRGGAPPQCKIIKSTVDYCWAACLLGYCSLRAYVTHGQETCTHIWSIYSNGHRCENVQFT